MATPGSRPGPASRNGTSRGMDGAGHRTAVCRSVLTGAGRSDRRCPRVGVRCPRVGVRCPRVGVRCPRVGVRCVGAGVGLPGWLSSLFVELQLEGRVSRGRRGSFDNKASMLNEFNASILI